MEKMKFIITGLLLFMAISGKAQDSTSKVEIGNMMPAFTIISDDGSQLSSSHFAGKVVLITFFATWCPPCQLELAEIDKLLWPKYKEYENFALLVIGREHSDAELLAYNEKKRFTFPLHPDKNRTIYESFASQYIPRTYLIDNTGKIIFKTQGYNESDFKRLLRTIDNALML